MEYKLIAGPVRVEYDPDTGIAEITNSDTGDYEELEIGKDIRELQERGIIGADATEEAVTVLFASVLAMYVGQVLFDDQHAVLTWAKEHAKKTRELN